MVTVIKKGSSVKTVLEKYEEIKRKRKKNSLGKLCGTLNLEQEPVSLQREWRNEWR